mmetsp:Transcript_30230/g.38988  ORF Transcript_30230/g.38988 Transcript_30230/m.38988 type:complete len:105 (-) Transcript_30230:268-582(-)
MKDTIEERMISLQKSKIESKGNSNDDIIAKGAAGSIQDDKVILKIEEFDSLFGLDPMKYPSIKKPEDNSSSSSNNEKNKGEKKEKKEKKRARTSSSPGVIKRSW